MAYCSRCAIVRLRLRRIPASAEHWGPVLASVIAASWAAALWDNGPGVAQFDGMTAMLALLGRVPAALWLTGIALMPLVDVLTDRLLPRVIGVSFGLVTWTALLIEIVLREGALRPSVGGCLVGLLGCLNADIGLARRAGRVRR
jgi:hypothetical protein